MSLVKKKKKNYDFLIGLEKILVLIRFMMLEEFLDQAPVTTPKRLD